MSNFWKIWLDIWCLADIIFGGVLVGASIPGFESGTKNIHHPDKPHRYAGFQRN